MSDWKLSAACAARGVDADIFHAGERNPIAVEQARTVCDRCPVRTQCLVSAYREGDDWSIRAGQTPRQRRAHLRKAGNNIALAVAEALNDTALLLGHIYQQHVKPTGDGHLVWTDHRNFINVRGKPYTVHRLAWIANYGVDPVGWVKRSCEVGGCVAPSCLTDQRMRNEAAAARKAAV